nr:reverse transcriptase domain-containing protein [Tanacetum cinerariifolium]
MQNESVLILSMQNFECFYDNAQDREGAPPVALAPYRLAPSEMQELSDQLQELADRELLADYDSEIRYHPGKANVVADALTGKILAINAECFRIGPVAYKLELPEKLSNVHNTFHVSNLKKCLSDESLVIPMKELQLDEKLNFVEEPVEIMDREVK